MGDPLSVIAYGGGVQSTALIVLATQGKLDATHALFSNVGDDSELPDTLHYVRTIITPWAADRGVQVEELQRTMLRGDQAGQNVTLYGQITRPNQRTIDIPVRMPDTGAPGNRSCTSDYKIKVISRWLKERGATEGNEARVAIGISTDEYQRASNRRAVKHEEPWYPLLEMGISRAGCTEIIARAGLPVPPKSSCFFCPLARPSRFAELRRDRPGLFQVAADLENLLNERRDMLGRDHVYLTRFGKPLAEAVPVAQDALFGFDEYGMDTDECDEGYCFV